MALAVALEMGNKIGNESWARTHKPEMEILGGKCEFRFGGHGGHLQSGNIPNGLGRDYERRKRLGEYSGINRALSTGPNH